MPFSLSPWYQTWDLRIWKPMSINKIVSESYIIPHFCSRLIFLIVCVFLFVCCLLEAPGRCRGYLTANPHFKENTKQTGSIQMDSCNQPSLHTIPKKSQDAKTLLQCRPLNSVAEWKWKKSQILQFHAHFCRNCKFFVHGKRCIFWPFSEFFRTLEHPERGKIVVLLNALFEQVLGDETSLFNTSDKHLKCAG